MYMVPALEAQEAGHLQATTAAELRNELIARPNWSAKVNTGLTAEVTMHLIHIQDATGTLQRQEQRSSY